MIKPLTPIPPCRLTYPLKRAGHATPALGPGHVTLKRIPLGQPIPSTVSAATGAALFGGFKSTIGLSDFPCPCILGVRP